MPYLTAAVVFVGALSALNLVLALAMVKRLREHSGLLTGRRGAPSADLEVGTRIAEFETVTEAGESLTRASLTEDLLVAFFSPGCAPCVEKLPAFVAHTRSLPGGRRGVLAVVVGEPREAAAFAAPLGPFAQVVVEEPNGALSRAFGVHSYPTLLRIGPDAEGRPVVTSNAVDLKRPTAMAA
ncbi:TlpA family protein disulfide reductase [Streptomyces sp. ID38640]|uniref:TlpA family protein disulfide reductase n=1 Tax=Streptomyces sp. ID38640 TaxID=1265399 RepID=UPI00140F1405|nr:TlpA disulfide reductase family protein [Streptomyces sp. ID38640]QIK04879.1 TlpA family protein disulfide reductase [Streptomyces sp. ID38640]